MSREFDYSVAFNNLPQNKKEELLKAYLDYANSLKDIADEELEGLDLELKHLFCKGE